MKKAFFSYLTLFAVIIFNTSFAEKNNFLQNTHYSLIMDLNTGDYPEAINNKKISLTKNAFLSSTIYIPEINVGSLQRIEFSVLIADSINILYQYSLSPKETYTEKKYIGHMLDDMDSSLLVNKKPYDIYLIKNELPKKLPHYRKVKTILKKEDILAKTTILIHKASEKKPDKAKKE